MLASVTNTLMQDRLHEEKLLEKMNKYHCPVNCKPDKKMDKLDCMGYLECIRFKICRSWVQIQFWLLADVVLGIPEFSFSATLVNSQLVCLPPVGILNLVMFIYHYLFILVLKSPNGEWPITYIFTFTYIYNASMLADGQNSNQTATYR